MIKSKFILDILDLIVDGEKEEAFLRQQIKYLTESEFEHTGVGLFVSFEHTDDANEFKLKEDLILQGVKIDCPELKYGADATLFIIEGFIDYIDILAHGDNYPTTDPKTYILSQAWQGNPDRQIIRK